MEKVEFKERKTSLGNAIILAAVFLMLGLFVGVNFENWFSGFAPYLGIESRGSSIDWSPLNEVYNRLAVSYNGEITEKEVIEGAKKGLVASLGDVYTVYMDAETSSDFYDDLHGNVGSGVGIEMGLRDGYVRVLRTLPDNPARKAGILAGDILYKVDGEDVYALSTDEISKKSTRRDGDGGDNYGCTRR